MTLLDKLPTEDRQRWYVKAAMQHGWSRAVFAHQIEPRLLERQGTATTSFQRPLLAPQSKIAQQMVKPIEHLGEMTKLLALVLGLIPFQVSALTLTTEEYPPFNFSKDGGKTITGHSTDVMREVVKRARIDASIALYPWRRAYHMAQNDKKTCVYSTTRTEAREKLFKWVGPLFRTSWVFYARADSLISLKTFDEARKYNIGGYQGDAKADYLKEKGFSVDEALTEAQTAMKLEAGRIDLWVGDSGTADWIAKNIGIKIKQVLSFKEVEMYAACNLSMSDEDINRMNDAVRAIKADGTYDRVLKSYH